MRLTTGLTGLVAVLGWLAVASAGELDGFDRCLPVAERHADEIMRMSSTVVAVGAGESRSDPSKSVVFVYLAHDEPSLQLPAELEGCPVEVSVTGSFQLQ